MSIDDEPNPWKPQDLGTVGAQSNAPINPVSTSQMNRMTKPELERAVNSYYAKNPPVTMRDLVEEAKAEAQAAKAADRKAVSQKVVKDVLAEIITEEFRAVLKEQNELIATMQEQIDELWAELRER